MSFAYADNNIPVFRHLAEYGRASVSNTTVIWEVNAEPLLILAERTQCSLMKSALPTLDQVARLETWKGDGRWARLVTSTGLPGRGGQ
jgi:hypothetical protein